jgi:hypothetical protein
MSHWLVQYLEFVSTHLSQLQQHDIPPRLWQGLERKLRLEQFDAAEVVEFAASEGGSRGGLELLSKRGTKIDPHSRDAIYLVDHAW